MNIEPKWITKELITEILQEHFQDKALNVQEVTFKAAIGSGENFCSDVIRLHIKYNSGKNGNQKLITIILKYIPNDILQGLSDALNLFDTEIEMFSSTILQMNEILGKPGLFSANCYLTYPKPKQTVLLEDLSPKGFVVVNRHDGLDLDHCLLALRKLALFHSASATLYTKNKNPVNDVYSSGMFAETDIIKTIILNGFGSFSKALKRWPEMREYYPKFAGLGDTAVERTYESWRKSPNGFNVLNHGDWWSNNMMFTYDSNKNVTDCKFIDFQLSVYTSPAIDLHYFMTSSPTVEVLTKHRDFLLNYYYAHLLLNLVELKFDVELIPTREEFMADYQKRAFYGLTTLACIIPLLKAPNRDDANFECLVLDESVSEVRHDIYRSEIYREWTRVHLQYYESIGAFVDFPSRL